MNQFSKNQPAGRSRLALALAGLLVLVATAGGVWWAMRPDTPAAAPVTADQAPVPDAGEPQAEASLEEGDALLAEQPEGPSNAARLAKLLKRDGMISALTAAVNMVAEGSSPAPALTFISIPGKYTVLEEGGQPAAKSKKRKKKAPAPPPQDVRVFVSPASYARYDDVTNVATSLDAASAAKKYARLRPYFDTAFKVIGRPGQRFDDVLTAAIQRLVDVKLLKGKVELERRVVVYVYKDPALEALGPAEKQFLRMGPRNGKIVQDYLRKFAQAAGLKIK